jgi:hypothetical protein
MVEADELLLQADAGLPDSDGEKDAAIGSEDASDRLLHAPGDLMSAAVGDVVVSDNLCSIPAGVCLMLPVLWPAQANLRASL